MHYVFSLLLAVLLGAAACNGAAQPSPDPAEPGPGDPAGQEVAIVDNAFDPATLSVSAGDSITWTNNGDVPHTVTFDEGPDSGNLSPGQTFTHTFDSVGSYTYVCVIHPTMQAVVNVDP